jgi:hypothetical protein
MGVLHANGAQASAQSNALGNPPPNPDPPCKGGSSCFGAEELMANVLPLG